MLFTELFSIWYPMKDIIKSLKSIEVVDEEKDDKFQSIFYCEILRSLIEELFKINYLHLLDEDEQMYGMECIDFDDYFSYIDENKEEHDKIVEEINLFKVISAMITHHLNKLTFVEKYDCIESLKTIFNTFGTEINFVFSPTSEVDASQLFDYVDEFIGTFLRSNFPDYFRRFMYMLEAIIQIDLIQCSGDYDLEDEFEPFKEIQLFKCMIDILLQKAKRCKDEFESERDYDQIVVNCEEFLQY
jgi:hypothetical protein